MTHDERETKAIDLRAQALGMLQLAQAIDGRLPFLAIHQHAYGSSGYVLWHTKPPTQKQTAAMLDAEFEPERGESLSIEESLTLRELTGLDSSHGIGSRAREPRESLA